jgi:hypothetical protein
MSISETHRVRQPVVVEKAVIVDKSQPLTSRFINAALARLCQSLLAFVDDSQPCDTPGTFMPLNSLLRFIGAVVVDNEDLPSRSVGIGLVRQAIENAIKN